MTIEGVLENYGLAANKEISEINLQKRLEEVFTEVESLDKGLRKYFLPQKLLNALFEQMGYIWVENHVKFYEKFQTEMLAPLGIVGFEKLIQIEVGTNNAGHKLEIQVKRVEQIQNFIEEQIEIGTDKISECYREIKIENLFEKKDVEWEMTKHIYQLITKWMNELRISKPFKQLENAICEELEKLYPGEGKIEWNVHSQ